MTRHHYKGKDYPVLTSLKKFLFVRRSKWKTWKRDGTEGKFISWWFWKLQWYHGSAKLDGSESILNGAPIYTDEPKELRAFRWISKGPQVTDKFNMAGS